MRVRDAGPHEVSIVGRRPVHRVNKVIVTC